MFVDIDRLGVRHIEKAQTYDEATRKGNVVRRRHPGAKVGIQFRRLHAVNL